MDTLCCSTVCSFYWTILMTVIRTGGVNCETTTAEDGTNFWITIEFTALIYVDISVETNTITRENF